MHLISRNDQVVPAEENTDLLAMRYRKMGGSIEIIEVKEAPKAKGHHFDHPNPKRVADFIEKHTGSQNRIEKGTSTRKGRAK